MYLNSNAHFLAAGGLKTRAGADSRFTRAFAQFSEKPLHFIIQNERGEFVPVAVLGEATHWMAAELARCGVYCVSAR